MRNNAFRNLLTQLQKLTSTQAKKVEDCLHQKASTEIFDNMTEQVEHCPHCNSTDFYKWGMRSGLQRYRCKECHKTFNPFTHTALARLRHKEVWVHYAQDIINGSSVRKSACHCKVANSTTFRWRHRMLLTPKKIKAKHLNGIVEFDETYFLASDKGCRHIGRKSRKRGGKASKRGISSEQIAVLIVRDRNGNTTDAILEKSNQYSIADIMLPLLAKDTLLCSDKKPAYKAFADKNNFKLKTVNVSAKEHINTKVFHIQNVNAYDSRLKEWMKHFHGVATKYLDSYLGWMRLLDREKSITPNSLLNILSSSIIGYQPLMRT